MASHIFTSRLIGAGLEIGNVNQKLEGSSLVEIDDQVSIEGGVVNLDVEVATLISVAIEADREVYIDTNLTLAQGGDDTILLDANQPRIHNATVGSPIFNTDVEFLFITSPDQGASGTTRLRITILADSTP